MEERAKYNAGFDLEELIDSLPAGLDRALLRIFSFHRGRAKAISRGELVDKLGMMGFQVHERAVRACISDMRQDGQPICSTGGDDGGYWWAENWGELEEFITREIHSRAMTFLEQEQALRQSAEKRWGRFSPEKQLRMFG